jgi:hypothetical protein
LVGTPHFPDLNAAIFPPLDFKVTDSEKRHSFQSKAEIKQQNSWKVLVLRNKARMQIVIRRENAP